MSSVQIVLFMILIVSCLDAAQSKLLSRRRSCLGARKLFINRGCVDNEGPLLCQLLAARLLFSVGGIPVCTAFPCAGYGQEAVYQCTGLLSCSAPNIQINGICNRGNLCCQL